MATPKQPSIDLREYQPDEAAADAMAERPADYNKNVDPKLRARLDELRRAGSNPDIGRAAPPSEAAYVPPVEIKGADPDRATLPRTEAKVELSPPPGPRDYPTQPSLKRFEGEPDLPGVVKLPSAPERGAAPRERAQRVSARTMVTAVLAVVLPVLMVIFLVGRVGREPERNGAPTSPPASATAAVPVATVPPPHTSEPRASASGPEPRASASGPEPTATASTAVPAPTGAAPRPKPRGAVDDPYDASAPSPAPSATAAPQVTAVPTAPPMAPPPPVPTAPTASSGSKGPTIFRPRDD